MVYVVIGSVLISAVLFIIMNSLKTLLKKKARQI